jgi:hypothetical protein
MQGEGKLRGLAATQAGHISSAQARAVGLSPTEYVRLRSTGRWVEVTPRVSSLVGAPSVRGERLFAATLDQGGDAAVAGEGAAWWWGVAGFSPRWPSVVTTSRTRHTTDLADVRRVRWLPDRWVTVFNGLRVVRPELMLLQLISIHFGRLGRSTTPGASGS